MKHVAPATTETAFNCPNCGAFAAQTWHSTYLRQRRKDDPLPVLVRSSAPEKFDLSIFNTQDEVHEFLDYVTTLANGIPLLETTEDEYTKSVLRNVNAANCFNCGRYSIWVADRLLFPVAHNAPKANPDMPDDVRRDFDEAGTIAELSPRGAAALLRLAIQKLCKDLGKPGENINADIKALVADGLNPSIQKALDIVRVIGNESVHPGHIDLRDDRATAQSLFLLVNMIVEKMISEPKQVDELYAKLPQDKLDGISKRDGK